MSDITIDAIKALDGRIFAMLDERERETLDFYVQRGRKFGVTVSLGGAARLEDLAGAKSDQERDEMLRRTNSTVAVTIHNQQQ